MCYLFIPFFQILAVENIRIRAAKYRYIYTPQMSDPENQSDKSRKQQLHKD